MFIEALLMLINLPLHGAMCLLDPVWVVMDPIPEEEEDSGIEFDYEDEAGMRVASFESYATDWEYIYWNDSLPPRDPNDLWADVEFPADMLFYNGD